MSKLHKYNLTTTWTGNKGDGTLTYRGYERSHTIAVESKVDLLASSDPAFLGDITKHNPEELLLASLSSCHMLWYLHLCATAGIIVTAYEDNAEGIMEETESGSGKFTEATLYPVVTVKDASMKEQAIALHEKANEMCFIANSVNFKVHHRPEIISAEQ